MKITFLGTSHGVPAADRYCSCTMLEVGDAVYIIDAGAPLIDLLLRNNVDLTRIRALFTTHMHGDHTNGVHAFADLANWYFRDISTDIYLTEQDCIDAYIHLLKVAGDGKFDDKRVRFRLMTADTVYDDGNIRVTPMPTAHMKNAGRPAYSYLVEAEGRKVLFSGDLSGQLREGDFPAYALDNEVDLMVCEMAHFGVEHVQPYLERCKAKQLCFNHVFPLDKIPQIEALDGQYPYPIRSLCDGDVIEL